MNKLLLSILVLLLCSCNSSDKDGKDFSDKTVNKDSINKEETIQNNGAPSKEEATQILQQWFDHFKTLVGGTSYEGEKFEVLSVTGDDKNASINFQWSGTVSPPSTPDSDHTPIKVTDQKKTLLVEKKEGKWITGELRG